MSDFRQEMQDRTAPIRETNRGPLAKLAELLSGLGGGERQNLDPLYAFASSLGQGVDPDRPYDWGTNPDVEGQMRSVMGGRRFDRANLDGDPLSGLSEEDLGIFLDRLLQEIDEQNYYASRRIP